MLKKKIALFISILLIISTLAVMVSAAPLVKSIKNVKISAGEAENIALENVGLIRENVIFDRTEIDRERGRLVWEVEFEKDNIEYSFEIDAVTGKIIDKDIETERKPSAPPATEQKPVSTELTREQAIEIALNDAGLTLDQVRELEIERDYERGTLVYEIEFEHGRKEYSYEIRISDGKLLTREIDIDD